MIKRIEAEQLLHMFGVQDEIIATACLQKSKYNKNFCYIYKVSAKDKAWVCRISRELNHSVQLAEMQSRFAMLLWENGIITAKKLQCSHAYCIELPYKNITVQAMAEEYLGEDFSNFTLDTFQKFGVLLGRMHFISERYSAKIGKSYVAEAIVSDKAVFSSILAKAVLPLPRLKEIENIEAVHNQLIAELSQIWQTLPSGAVHGDLGLYNNLIETKFGLGVIDFNLAGDEVYAADALASFYASIHKYSWQDKMKNLNREKALADFLNGYCRERKFCDLEKKYFSKISALFDGLFFCKAMIELWNDGRCKTALSRMPEALLYFDSDTHMGII